MHFHMYLPTRYETVILSVAVASIKKPSATNAYTATCYCYYEPPKRIHMNMLHH